SQAPPVIVEVPRERQADERNAPPSLPVQGEIRVDNGSKTSSSSSSSSDSGSSSSDSDSDSSSASGSDAGSQ
ncbi:transcription factor GTE4-like, partial [Trifolium medium]|nr:transcription factor GTE4-like [Trifolium medium]